MGNLRRVFQIICLWRMISANSAEFSFDEDIYQLANEIIDDYLQEYACVTYAADDLSHIQSLQSFLPIVVINLSPMWDDPENELLIETYEQGCGGYIVQTNMANRIKLVRKLKDAKRAAVGNRYNRERYLFLAESDNDTNADFLLDDCMYFLPNIVFVSRDNSSGKFNINNNAVFDPSRKDLVEVIDSWTRSKGFERHSNLYWDKTLDVKGRAMVFGVMQYHPYSVVYQEGNKTLFDGIEYRISKMYIDIINGTYVGRDHPKHLWGTKFPNGSGNGILGSVLSRESDFGYAAIYQWYCDVVDCTFPYIQAEAICLVPRPRVLNSWYTLWLPFTTSTWTWLSVTYFLSSGFFFIISLAVRRLYGARISGTRGHIVSVAFRSAFDMYRLHLQQVPPSAHKTNPLATYIKVSLVYYFFLSVLWQAGVASILTVPRYEKPIDSPAELVARWPKMEWGSNHKVWIYAIENSTDPVLKELVEKYLVLDNDTLVRRSKTRDFTYFLEKLPNNHFGFNDHISELTVPYLRTMKQHVYTASAVIILPRGSPFTEKLDHMIHWLYATGIIQKLEYQVSIERINNHLQTMLRFSDEKEDTTTVLTVDRIQAPLFIYLGGVLISILALIGEKFLNMKIYKRVNRTKIKRIFLKN